MSSQVETNPSRTVDPPPRPDNNLVGAILSTLCCCLPFGIVSIVYAAQVNTKYSVGDYGGAAESAAKSKTWMWWGVGIGLVLNLIAVLVGAFEER
jgi:ABC-type multidrug transport system permease subunit